MDMNAMLKLVARADEIARNKKYTKPVILMDIGSIANRAKNNEIKDVQSAFASAIVLADAYGFMTMNRFFPECLQETYMDAYGSSEDDSVKNLSISDKGMFNSIYDRNDITVLKPVPKNDYFLTVLMNQVKHHDKTVIRPLTNSDIYYSLHHALKSVIKGNQCWNKLADALNKYKQNQ